MESMSQNHLHVMINNSQQPQSTSTSSEDTPLLLKTSRSCSFLRRYRSTRKCITSKAASLILVWSFLLGLMNGLFLNPDLYMRTFVTPYTSAGYGFVAFFTLFFPLAGFRADVKQGRYRVVVWSLFIALFAVPELAALTIWVLLTNDKFILVSISCLAIMSFVSLVDFTANVIQFGMDQLHDSPAEDSSLFIHWYVWTNFFSIFIGQLTWSFVILRAHSEGILVGCCLLGSISLIVSIAIVVSLCLARQRNTWFLIIKPGRVNPYKVVHKVTKFSRQHKVPVHRSAFTYCEEEVPTGLDLGKEKYGGPFTTEQVEDVKAFYGILKVLVSFGTVFFLDYAANLTLPIYALHTTPYSVNRTSVSIFQVSQVELSLLNHCLLSPLLVVVCIPVYLCLLRPFISHYIPGMLTRMGIGMCLTLLSLIATFFMDLSAHVNGNNSLCMFELDSFHFDDPSWTPVPQSSWFLLFPIVLTSLSHILTYTAAFEFICAQSPHCLRSLIIGLFYTTKGLYQLLATLFALLPLFLGSPEHGSISCGFYYYLSNVGLGVVAILVYTWVAKRYRYRERDEPDNIHRYAEEYYSNPQQEQYYDYD